MFYQLISGLVDIGCHDHWPNIQSLQSINNLLAQLREKPKVPNYGGIKLTKWTYHEKKARPACPYVLQDEYADGSMAQGSRQVTIDPPRNCCQCYSYCRRPRCEGVSCNARF